MNLNNIKNQFPIFSKKINGKSLVYLDSSNSSQKPINVLNKLDEFYRYEFSNVGRSIHSLAVKATNKFDETRVSIKNFINAKSKDEIILALETGIGCFNVESEAELERIQDIAAAMNNKMKPIFI